LAKRRWTRPLVTLAAVSLLAACGDSPTDEGHDQVEDIERWRVTIGGTVALLDGDNGAFISGTNPLVINGQQQFQIEFLDGDGNSMNSALQGEFEVRVAPANGTLVTFARTGPFAGLVTRMGSGPTTLGLTLFHLEEDHAEEGPFSLNVSMP
jgi:hypothetical protein